MNQLLTSRKGFLFESLKAHDIKQATLYLPVSMQNHCSTKLQYKNVSTQSFIINQGKDPLILKNCIEFNWVDIQKGVIQIMARF